MSAHTVITHAQIQGEESAAVQLLRVALANATDARRAAEDAARDMGYTMPDLCEDVRNAVRAETAAYLALFDARRAPSPSPVGVSLAKASDYANGVVMCPSVAELDRRGSERVDVDGFGVVVAYRMGRNDLRGLQRLFGALGRRVAERERRAVPVVEGSPFCAFVLSGCDHTAVMDASGCMVACAEVVQGR